MTKAEVKEILEKQLQLLSEDSKAMLVDGSRLTNNSSSMCEIVRVWASLEDER